MADVVDSARRVRAYPGDLCRFSMRIDHTEVSNDGKDLLATILSLVHVRVYVDIRDKLVQNRTGRFNHPVGELRAHAHCMTFTKQMTAVRERENIQER